MSRAQDLIIQAQEATIAGLRSDVAALRSELTGERRGEHRVASQMSRDIEASALRADSYRRARDHAFRDVRRLLAVIADHVLDQRALAASLAEAVSAELLVEAVTLAGFNLNGPLAVQSAERADAAARAHAHMSAAALADAPVPPRAAAR